MKSRFFLGLALAALLAAPAQAANPHTISMTGHGEIRGTLSARSFLGCGRLNYVPRLGPNEDQHDFV